MSMADTQALAQVGRALVLIAMVAAAVSKSRDLNGFAHDLSRSFVWLQGTGARVVAIAILIAEWAIITLIVAGGDAARIGMLMAFVLMSAFTAVVAWSVLFDRDLICSCFGSASSHRMNSYDLARNLVLMAASALAWRHASGNDIVGVLATQSATASLAYAASGFIVFLLITSLQDIALLLRVEVGR